jgi:tRNA G10  N-methylase Trm11
LPGRPRFSVSASFVGRRNYTNAEVETAVARAIARRGGWEWEPNDGLADLLVRVFIVHERGWIGLRLTRRPLHRRSYKAHHRPGSLRPPVAAAMCRLARVARGSRLVDPCCGAGTIVAEAAALGAHAIGGDVAFEALMSAAGNLRTMSPRPSLVCWDACRLPLTIGWADAAVSNPPWDVQVIAAGGVNWLQRELLAQLRRAVRPGGRAVLLVEAPHVVRNPGWTLERSIMVSMAGRRPTILVLRAIDEVT